MECAIVKYIRGNIESVVLDFKIVADLALSLLFGAAEPFEYDKPTTSEPDVN